MATGTDRIEQLEAELDHLMHEVERYRSAAEDALQQLDWCIGYFTGSKQGDDVGVRECFGGQLAGRARRHELPLVQD